ncbi:major facilitator superfamily protein [Citrobacter freundii]|nr:major facilitator superfamily protein [Citrobacter freundii]
MASPIGNYLGGKLADRSVNGTLKGFLLLLMVIMLAIPFLARNELGAAVSMVAWGGCDVCGRSAVADARDARCQRSAWIIIVSQHWRV